MGDVMFNIFVVSDGTGGTADRLVRAALAQFKDARVRLVRRSNIRGAEQIRAVVEEAKSLNSVILHTLVSDRLRRFMLSEARMLGVDSLDMLGPLMERLATHLELTPEEKPGLFSQLEEARSREIEAVAYAFHHDDGQNVDELDRAEVVLVGVSRAMKTPTMLYLAYRGWFAANVPIIPEIDLPEPLLALPSARVFGLFMSAERLLELRRVRAEKQAIPVDTYASSDQVRKELHHAKGLCREHGWREIDTTGKSVEEVCREIIALAPSQT
jgi:regulator of PEP synthase PpsR (kinase-PPPase family)